MDQDELINNAKKWYPISAAILSVILNFLAFMIGIGWSTQYLFWTFPIALLGTMAFSALVIWGIYKFSLSGASPECITLESKDIYNLCDPKQVVYRKFFTIKITKPSDFYKTVPPNSEGDETKIRVFRVENGSEINVPHTIEKQYGRKRILIHFDRTRKKGEIIRDYCIESLLVNSFKDEREGVSVSSEIGQKKCAIEIILPSEPLSSESIVSYNRNDEPLKVLTPSKHIGPKGEYHLTTEFSGLNLDMNRYNLSTQWWWNPINF